jgi:hypothetical protein
VLVQVLAQHDLVDEYSLLVYPVVLGSGKKQFADRCGSTCARSSRDHSPLMLC